MFPILDNASLEVQLGIAPSPTASMSLEEAYQVIKEQSSQISALDELVVQLRAEKVVLETQLAQHCSTDVLHSDTIHSNSTAGMSTRHFIPTTPSPTVTAPPRHLIPSIGAATSSHAKIPSKNRHTRHASPSRSPAMLHTHSIGQVPSPSHRSVHRSHLQKPPQSTHHKRVSPLRFLGDTTVECFDDLGVPDHHHNTVCDIVESTLPVKWESSLVSFGVVGEEDVGKLIEAMEFDLSLSSDC